MNIETHLALVEVLQELRPEGGWSLEGDSYEQIRWAGNMPPPSKAEVQAKLAEGRARVVERLIQVREKESLPDLETQVELLWKVVVELQRALAFATKKPVNITELEQFQRAKQSARQTAEQRVERERKNDQAPVLDRR